MNLLKRTLYPLAAICLIATGVTSTPARADMDVVAVMATQTRLSNDAVFDRDIDRQWLVNEFKLELTDQLADRLVAEFDSTRRSNLLADDFAKQIIESLDERLPEEVSNLISSLK